MSQRISRGELRELIAGFRHTAYRLELLPAYAEDSEADALRTFAAGGQPEIYPGKRKWLETVQLATAGDGLMQRVHVVPAEDLSDYLRFEIGWSYALNAEAGEDIRILPATDAPAPLAQLGDYWLFDSRNLVTMDYDAAGRLTELTRVTDPAVIVEANYWRDAALHAAVPLARYRASQPAGLRRAS